RLFGSARRPESKPIRRSRLAVEPLEDRTTPATFTVNAATDANAVFAITAGKLDLGGEGSGTTGDLRYCLSQANMTPGADDIVFSLPAGTTIKLNQLLMIYDDVTIRGDTAANLTLSGQDLHRVFYVNNGTVAIDNLKIAHGLAQGGAGGTAAIGDGGGA